MQHVNTEKAQQHEELSCRVQQLDEQSKQVEELEATLLSCFNKFQGYKAHLEILRFSFQQSLMAHSPSFMDS